MLQSDCIACTKTEKLSYPPTQGAAYTSLRPCAKPHRAPSGLGDCVAGDTRATYRTALPVLKVTNASSSSCSLVLQGKHGCMSRYHSALPGSGAGRRPKVRRRLAPITAPALPHVQTHMAALPMELCQAVHAQRCALQGLR